MDGVCSAETKEPRINGAIAQRAISWTSDRRLFGSSLHDSGEYLSHCQTTRFSDKFSLDECQASEARSDDNGDDASPKKHED